MDFPSELFNYYYRWCIRFDNRQWIDTTQCSYQKWICLTINGIESGDTSKFHLNCKLRITSIESSFTFPSRCSRIRLLSKTQLHRENVCKWSVIIIKCDPSSQIARSYRNVSFHFDSMMRMNFPFLSLQTNQPNCHVFSLYLSYFSFIPRPRAISII